MALHTVKKTLSSVNKTLLRTDEDREFGLEVTFDPAKYYKLLDYALKILFKREVLMQLTWSPETFHLRMRTGKFHPSELMMLEKIIKDETYMKYGLTVLK